MKTTGLVLSLLLFLVIDASAQPVSLRIDPPNWWVGMKNPKLQLQVYGPGMAGYTFSINYPGVKLGKTTPGESPNYAFLDLTIDRSAKPGKITITGKAGTQSVTMTFDLLARTAEPKGTGITTSDLIYLIMPDRFANGDPSNDKFADMLDPSADRTSPYLRHGGDFKGIIDHLDYLQELGVTALWLTPVIDNDEYLKKEGPDRMQAGYHGYHFTDHYKIDRRFGGNEGYVAFAKALHAKGMKLVQDAVYNHVSDDHWMFKDRPFKDWFNNWPVYTNSSHKEQPLFDPYASNMDRDVMLDGWFTPFLPDLNQRNPFLATYLIQHAIWSTEMFSLDAWRIDTYKYNDQPFMNRCNEALLAEYPNIHLFGESVAPLPSSMSYFVKNRVAFPFKSNLPGTLDFPLNYAINDALRQNFGWDTGVSRIHQTLAQDFVYEYPMKLVTQLDNHDMDRFYSVVGEDLAKFKIGVTWLLTLRGIPSWYYGTEILAKNFKNPTDAEVRKDFPGGFAGDVENKFTATGRSQQENEAFEYIKTLTRYRRATPAVHAGKLMQFVPQDGIYAYFRYDAKKTILIITNSNSQEKKVEMARFAERMKGFSTGRNVITGESVNNLGVLQLPAKSVWILELLP